MKRYIILDTEHDYDGSGCAIAAVEDFDDWLDAVRCLVGTYHSVLDTETGKVYSDYDNEVMQTHTDFGCYMQIDWREKEKEVIPIYIYQGKEIGTDRTIAEALEHYTNEDTTS